MVDAGLSIKSNDGTLLPLSSSPRVLGLKFATIHVLGTCMSWRVWDSRGIRSSCVYSILDYGHSGGDMSRFERFLNLDIKSLRQSLTDSSFLLAGDFNLHLEAEARVEVDCPLVPATFACLSGPMAARWQKIFYLLVEVRSPLPINFCAADNILNTLMWMFVFVGRSVLPLLAHQAGVVRDLIYFHARGLLGDAPSFRKLSTQLECKGIQCLQHDWCRHLAYGKRQCHLCNTTGLDPACGLEGHSVERFHSRQRLQA